MAYGRAWLGTARLGMAGQGKARSGMARHGTTGVDLLAGDLMVSEEELLAEYIERKWPWFKVRTEVPLKEIFPEPENKGLKHIWKYGHADVVVYHHNTPICIYEPGGSHHFEEKQARNDRRKYKLCQLNNCRCIHMMTGIFRELSNGKFRQLIRKGLG